MDQQCSGLIPLSVKLHLISIRKKFGEDFLAAFVRDVVRIGQFFNLASMQSNHLYWSHLRPICNQVNLRA